MYVEGPLFDKKLNAVKHTIKLLEAFEPRIHITLACSGDPLASHIYRPFVHSYKAKPSQTFTLFTNGLLLKKQLEKTSIINAITRYQISVDAGSAEVYPEVRHGGDWNILMENFEFLQSQGLSDRVTLEFIVQKKNFRDIDNLVKLVNRFGFTGRLTQLDNWGTWNYDTVVNPDQWTIKNGTFREHNVLDQRHELYTECKEIVQSVLTNKNLRFSTRLLQLLDLQNSQ
jgi:molybdenum cofactor biosynthesis enzyme MoaA